ncbi:hypothetical protein ONE63_009554 [Megalurothrips usitatus]|uniref:Secreted protein n=1 Tax=Megalurothrips usitatus TaxID=439358 RepID=A0AAV7XK03_9NEOP|nr:hypothetical protein ONE63_009554 [Megalurothrips usitatus]
MFKIALLVATVAALAQSIPVEHGAAQPTDVGDRLDQLESCLSSGTSEKENQLTAIFQKCRAENDKDFRVRLCMIKSTARSDLKEMTKLLWCLFKS